MLVISSEHTPLMYKAYVPFLGGGVHRLKFKHRSRVVCAAKMFKLAGLSLDHLILCLSLLFCEVGSIVKAAQRCEGKQHLVQ